jgi:capsid protein
MKLTNMLSRGLGRLGYDAASSSRRRSRRKTDLRNEDRVANGKTRAIITSTTRDERRNLPDFGWAIRQHVANVSRHTFEVEHPDAQAWSTRVEELLIEVLDGSDIRGRFSFDELMALAEKLALENGDCLMIDTGDKLQLVKGDRIGKPDLEAPAGYDFTNEERFRDGIEFDPETGADVRFCVCTRNKAGKRVFDRWVEPKDAILHGYFDEPEQLRGVSPLAASLNTWTDIGDARAYALARAKIEQLMGLKITSPKDEFDEDELLREEAYAQAVLKAEENNEDPPPAPTAQDSVDLDFSKGPITLNLPAGKDAGFMTADSPHANLREFLRATIMAALKAVDLDFVTYDPSAANYSSGRLAMLRYEVSAAARRARVARLRMWCAKRALGRGLDGQLDQIDVDAPEVYDGPDSIRLACYEAGVGWFDPLKETRADAGQIASCTNSRKRIIRKRLGCSAATVIGELAAEAKLLAASGLKDDAALIGSTPDTPATDQEEDPANNPAAAEAAGAA